ncbi:Z band alternatively spliced PDZ-motif protein 66 [Carabus blaptoides fortunei]
MSFQRPSFWKVPKKQPEPSPFKPIRKKVNFGSPVTNNLQSGDIISKIGNYDARDVRHQDAQNLFKNAGTNIKVVVQRETSNRHNTSTASSHCSSQTPLSISPNLSPRGPQQSFNSPGGSATYMPTLQPYHTEPFPVLSEGYYREYVPGSKPKRNEDEELEHVVNQPYRTTPLVLPGAKLKREAGLTESYLRHHPNPNVRSPPHHVVHEHLMKQRVADSVIQRVVNENPTNKQIVHKQFNSPIGMYSDSNIVDTIKHQAGLTIGKKYDPSVSETYKALQEEKIGDHVQEVTVPVQQKIFAPNKVIPGKKPLPYNQPQTPQNYVNSMGNAGDNIQQSGSFKRLMYHVMAESDY